MYFCPADPVRLYKYGCCIKGLVANEGQNRSVTGRSVPGIVVAREIKGRIISKLEVKNVGGQFTLTMDVSMMLTLPKYLNILLIVLK